MSFKPGKIRYGLEYENNLITLPHFFCTVMPTGITEKTKIQIEKILAGYMDNKTQGEIASDLAVDRWRINDIQKYPEFQLRRRQVTEQIFIRIMQELDDMLSSDKPLDRRDAIKSLIKVWGTLHSKAYPTQHEVRSETTHVTVSPSQLAWRQFFDLACPDCQRKFIAHVNKDLPKTPKYVDAEAKAVS